MAFSHCAKISTLRVTAEEELLPKIEMKHAPNCLAHKSSPYFLAVLSLSRRRLFQYWNTISNSALSAQQFMVVITMWHQKQLRWKRWAWSHLRRARARMHIVCAVLLVSIPRRTRPTNTYLIIHTCTRVEKVKGLYSNEGQRVYIICDRSRGELKPYPPFVRMQKAALAK